LAWNSLGDYKKAIECYEKALTILKDTYGETYPNVATALNNLELAWHALGNPKKAIEYLQQAYTIFQKVYGDDHPNTRDVKESLDFLRNTS
jgi:tetratricopeptide (TPR) repeat protein